MRQNPIDIEKKMLSGHDLKNVLKICGHTVKDFTNEVDKSYDWVRNTLGKMLVIPYKYYDLLVDFVSEDNFNLAIEQIEEKRQKYNDRREKLGQKKG